MDLTLAGLLVAALIGTAFWLVFRDTREELLPSYFIDDDLEVLDGLADETESLCGARFECESAVGNADISILKFATQEEAAQISREVGANAYRSDWLVAIFAENVTALDRRYVSEMLDGTWQSKVD